MENWFECKIRYDKTIENGMVKKVIEPYLVDALSFTEAERRITEESSAYISGEFEVTDIKKMKLSEIFFSDDTNDDKWYKAKLQFITLDEKTGAEKLTSVMVLVQSSSFKDSIAKLEKGMNGSMADYIIASVSETAIMDVYPYKKEDNDE